MNQPTSLSITRNPRVEDGNAEQGQNWYSRDWAGTDLEQWASVRPRSEHICEALDSEGALSHLSEGQKSTTLILVRRDVLNSLVFRGREVRSLERVAEHPWTSSLASQDERGCDACRMSISHRTHGDATAYLWAGVSASGDRDRRSGTRYGRMRCQCHGVPRRVRASGANPNKPGMYLDADNK